MPAQGSCSPILCSSQESPGIDEVLEKISKRAEQSFSEMKISRYINNESEVSLLCQAEALETSPKFSSVLRKHDIWKQKSVLETIYKSLE